MRLLDLFCGAGGAATGYFRAGFAEITGVDIKPQKHYPFRLVQGDALDHLAGIIESGEIAEYDAIHASPPCQMYSNSTKHLSNGKHPKLVDSVRGLLEASGRPYVIENVSGAPLQNPLLLCGSMFGLAVIRHRLFECRPPIWFPPHPCQCKHGGATGGRLRRAGITRTPSLNDGMKYVTVAGNNYLADEGRSAMGIDWMSKQELSQAIPPVYTEWIGGKLIIGMQK